MHAHAFMQTCPSFAQFFVCLEDVDTLLRLCKLSELAFGPYVLLLWFQTINSGLHFHPLGRMRGVVFYLALCHRAVRVEDVQFKPQQGRTCNVTCKKKVLAYSNTNGFTSTLSNWNKRCSHSLELKYLE